MENTPAISTKDYLELINPLLAQRLELLHLDKIYYKGKGAYLYYFDDKGKEVKVIDFVSGYGAVLLGHNPGKLRAAAIAYLRDNRPGFVQMSVKDSATRTARWLHDEMKTITGQEFITAFANSGAEAIEAAIKHALMEFYERINGFSRKFEQEAAYLIHSFSGTDESPVSMEEKEINRCRIRNKEIIQTNAPIVLAAQQAFHGKTLRAALTCWNPEYSRPFSPDNPVTQFTDWDLDALQKIFRQVAFDLLLPGADASGRLQFHAVTFNRIAAAIVEPIQGEGGIRIVPEPFIRQLAQCCRVYDTPLIFDEIQTGCYRTGYLLASAQYGITAGYYVLGKALGGGLAKISAVLIDKQRYSEPFGLIHSSTFAEDGWSSYVALKALELSKAKSPEIRTKGDKIIQRLRRLQQAYPSIIRDVRGQGLMIGLEFKDFSESNSYCFQMLARGGYLHYLYAAYLLNTWNIRLAAPLSAKNVLRIQPAVSISKADIDRLMQGLYALCEALYCEDFYKLIEFSLPGDCQGLRASPERFRHGDIPRETPREGARKVGFLTHFIDAGTVRAGDPSLNVLDDGRLEELVEKILPLGTPAIAGSKNIIGENGKAVHITFAGLSLTSAMCRNAISNKATQPQIELCRKAAQVLKEEEQVEVVGLGQYSSIVTNNGRLIPETGVGLTTGNSLTAYLAMEAVKSRLREKGINIKAAKIGIIGAAGNIASILAELFSDNAGGVILLGNSNKISHQKAVRTARNIYQKAAKELLENGCTRTEGLARWLIDSGTLQKIQNGEFRLDDPLLYEKLEKIVGPRLFLRVVRSIDDFRECRVVIVATNAAKPFLNPEHFSPHTIICDLSVPHNCGPALIHNNKSIEVIFGGVAHLPHGECIPVKGFPLEAGQVYGCMGETLLLGLEGFKKPFSLGNITLRQVEWIGEIAQKHGFSPLAVSYHANQRLEHDNHHK